MADNIGQQKLLRVMERLSKRFHRDGDLDPIESCAEWGALVETRPAEERQVLKELASFADLWRYLHERNQKLGQEIVNRIEQLQELPITQRISELKDINQTLLRRIGNADQSPKLRQ